MREKNDILTKEKKNKIFKVKKDSLEVFYKNKCQALMRKEKKDLKIKIC